MSLLLKKLNLNKSNVSSVLKNGTMLLNVLKKENTRIIKTSSSSDNEKEIANFEEEIQPCTVDLFLVQQILQSHHVELDQSQRENLFHTCCKVLDNICSVIVVTLVALN